VLGLQLARVGSGGLAGLLLAKGLDLSTDTGGHEFVTYLGFYGFGVLFALMAVGLTIVIHSRKEATAHPRTRPLRWEDLRTMRVPLESDTEAEVGRTAKRGARHVHAELDASRKKLNDALANGYWWNVRLEGLQSGEWGRAKDSLADEAPKVYDAVAPIYVLVDDMNAQANNHDLGGTDHFDENTAQEMRSLRGKIRTVQRVLQEYYEA
jgi:hypothetical protein